MLEIRIEGITKHYRNKVALDGINGVFTNGIYGLLGANGSGKTTLLRIICDILKPTAGEVTCDGIRIQEMRGNYRRLLGYLPQDFGYYPDFTAYRYLMYIASLKAIASEKTRGIVEEMLELVGLWEEKNKKIKTFSGGMIRRLGIAQAMLNNPKVLILDEPTAGLDPKERIRFRNIISSLAKDRIIILSTHIVSDVEYIANEIMLIKEGRFIQKGTLEQITKSVEGHVWECLEEEKESEKLNREYPVSQLKNIGGRVKLRIISKEKPTETAVMTEPNLEDVYLYYFREEGK